MIRFLICDVELDVERWVSVLVRAGFCAHTAGRIGPDHDQSRVVSDLHDRASQGNNEATLTNNPTNT